MSYLTFHLIFLVPPIGLMLLGYRRPESTTENRWVDVAIPLICLIALSYTTPWDNYLVARSVWWYGPDRVIGTIGHVPIEEYLFFILQPLLTGLFLYHYLDCYGRASTPSVVAPWAGAGLFAGLTILGAVFFLDGRPHTLYMGLLLLWASPLLAGMWLYGGETLWALRSVLLVTVGLPTLYLWGADAIAIRAGVWTISTKYTIGVTAFGLPLEEAGFFLFTNLLVVQGLLLFLYRPRAGMPSEEQLP